MACFDICMRQRDMTWWSCHEGWCRHKAQSRRHTLHWCAQTHLGSNLTHILDPIWYISWIQSNSYLGSNLMHILDPVWYMYWIQSGTYLGSNLIHILDSIWYISWIGYDTYLGSDLLYHVLNPVQYISWIQFDIVWIRSDIHHTLHFLIQLFQHTRTHTVEGGFQWSSDVGEWPVATVVYPHPLAESWSRLRGREENIHRVISKYSKLTTLVNAIFSEEAHAHAHDDCIIGQIVITLWPDHPPPYILGSNVNWLDHHWCCCCCCKAPCLKSWIFDLHLQIFLWFQFGIVGAIFQTVVTPRI